MASYDGAGVAMPADISPSASEGAVARAGLVVAQRRARRHEVCHHVGRGLRGLVARDVRVVADVDVALARMADDRGAGRVVGLVEGHGPLNHRDEDGAGVAVPAAL